MKNTLIFIIAITIAGGAGYGLQRYLAETKQETKIKANPIIGQQRPEFAMTDLDGELRNIKDWDGKIILLNFWATWCPPCIKEIPLFVELQNTYADQGFQVVGIAIDDEDAVRAFADDMEVNYPVMVSELEAIELSRRYGNRIGGLPYTVIINRKGEISHTITGDVDKIKAEKILKKHGLKIKM